MVLPDVPAASGAATTHDECPVDTIDERAARLVAFMVVVLAVLSLWQQAWGLMGALAVDFFVRAWFSRRYSPLRWCAKRALRVLGVPPRPVYAPPKRFAARIGSVLTLAALALHVMGLHAASIVVTAALIAAASLEAFLGFCIACWLYPLLSRIRSLTGAR